MKKIMIFAALVVAFASCKKNEDDIPQPAEQKTSLMINEPEYYLNEVSQAVLTVSAPSLGEETGLSFKARSSSRTYPITPTFMEYNKYAERYQGTVNVPVKEGDTLWVTLFAEDDVENGTYARLDVIPGASKWKNWTYLPNLGEAYYVLPGGESQDSVQLKFGTIELMPNSMDVHIIGVNYSDQTQKISLNALVNTSIIDGDSVDVNPGLFDEIISLDGFASNTLVDLYLKVNAYTQSKQVRTEKNEYTNLSFASKTGLDSIVITPQQANFVLGTVKGSSTGSLDLRYATLSVSIDSMSDSTNLSDYFLDIEGVTAWDPSDWTKSGMTWSITVPVKKTAMLGNFSISLLVKTNKNYPGSYDKASCTISFKDKDGVVIAPKDELWLIFRK